MKTKLIILGCCSSIGGPRIDGHWGNCNKNEKKNIRTRGSAIIIKGKNYILIDTSVDLKYQLLSNNNCVTHEYSDFTFRNFCEF